MERVSYAGGRVRLAKVDRSIARRCHSPAVEDKEGRRLMGKAEQDALHWLGVNVPASL